ncbi:MAG: hypothetical protein EOP64_00085 [Sphingomonas sp.]|nr:MAG: hypothetical protein EOP64_00085 [Sphingomonas sp.]
MTQIESVHALQAAGFNRDQAETLIMHVEKIIDNRVATKADLVDLRSEMRLEMGKLSGSIGEVKYVCVRWIVSGMVLNSSLMYLLKHFG